jgi:PKD repeat protein
MRRWNLVVVVLTGVALLIPGCTSKKQPAPALTGPSELALSFSVQASPDVLRQDGASQSRITILARDPAGQPVRSLAVRVEVAVGGVIVDYGQLSAKNLVTGADGSTQVVYTAPNPSPDPSSQGGVIEIVITPVGTNYANTVMRSVSIRLVPPGVILPPGTPPKPAFIFSPSAPQVLSEVLFDASSSTSASPLVSYNWNFGDGTGAAGPIARHAFQQPSGYTVTLTVTDDTGMSASVTHSVTVSSAAVPTASFVFSPATPAAGQEVFFNASASVAGSGRRLVGYDWDFGTGRTGTGISTSKTYDSAGDYIVTLVVTDDVGQKATTSKTVKVGGADPFADFSVSPSDPTTGQIVNFNASASTSSVGLKSGTWDFGDGTGLPNSTSISAQHAYTTPGTYVVRLTVTDNKDRTATTTKTVTVKAP